MSWKRHLTQYTSAVVVYYSAISLPVKRTMNESKVYLNRISNLALMYDTVVF